MLARNLLFTALFISLIAFPGCQKVEDSYISGTEQMLADELYREGKYEKALNMYKKAIKEDSDGILYLKVGKTYEQLGNMELAKENYLKAEEKANFLKDEVGKKLDAMASDDAQAVEEDRAIEQEKETHENHSEHQEHH